MDITIRKWQPDDIDGLVQYANNRNISDNLADAFPFPYTKEFGQKFIGRVANEMPTKIFAIIAEDNAIGSVGVFPDADIHRKNAVIAYWVAEPYWGKGVATKAIQLIVEYGFKTFDVTRIYAKPFGGNIGSHKALGHAGFVREAVLKGAIYKNGNYLDEYIYSLTREQ